MPALELDLSGLKLPARTKIILSLIVAAVLVVLGFTGARFTTVSTAGRPQVLSWSGWQLLRAERAYQRELERLQREADGLVELLNQSSDPVRAQITAERIAKQYASGEPALAHPRALLITAANAVQDWSVGVVDDQVAQEALQAAQTALQDAARSGDG